MWMEMFFLLVAEGLVITLLVYVIGAAVVRNLFWPKVAVPRLVGGYFLAIVLSPVIAMVLARHGTWRDASDQLLSSSWMSSAAVLALLAIIQLSSNERQSSIDDDKESIEPNILDESEIQDVEVMRQLMSIRDQLEVGLLSEQEAERKRTELLSR